MALDLTSPTIAGPFYFAWINPYETDFDPFTHAREDEKIVTFTVEQSEGDFATLTIEIKNPRVGLLGLNRQRHCFLSYAGQGQSPADVRPLFRGRLVGLPDNLNGEAITLVFTGRPDDYADRKETLAYALQELPYYDPVFISPDSQENPDTVLETRGALWHIDRVTGEVTISDNLVGEDGTAAFAQNEVPYDSVQVHINQTPLRKVQVTANVGWQQADSGVVTWMMNNQFESYLADSVAKAWPAAGASLGGGWSMDSSRASSSIDNIPSDAFHTEIIQLSPPDPIPEDQVVIEPPPPPPRGKAGLPIPEKWILLLTHFEMHAKSSEHEASLQVQENGTIIPFVSILLSANLRYDASRNKKEVVQFTVEADTQSLLTDPGEDERLFLTLSGNDLGKDNGDGLAIGDVRRRQYFTTARGLQSLEYLILLARASLLLRARAVEITFACPFDRAIDLSCRMNAQVEDDRLPGSTATGKITKYSFSADGDTGEVIGNVTMECAVGFGDAVDASAGEPTYVNVGYVNEGYQFYTNQVSVLPAGDIAYTVPGGPPLDDGLSFPLTGPVFTSDPQFFPVEFVAEEFPRPNNLADSDESAAAQEAIRNLVQSKRCHFDFTLKSVTGSTYSNIFNVTTSLLQVPKQIDLSAASV